MLLVHDGQWQYVRLTTVAERETAGHEQVTGKTIRGRPRIDKICRLLQIRRRWATRRTHA